MVTALKPRRSDIPSDANLCEYCTAKCCRYFALPIDKDRGPFMKQKPANKFIFPKGLGFLDR